MLWVWNGFIEQPPSLPHLLHIDAKGLGAATAERWPIVIQTLFLQWRGRGPSEVEVDAYLRRLQAVRDRGTLHAIQLYTVARPTPEPEARPLPAAELDLLAAKVADAMTGVPVEVYYGPA